jgi:hypothetical protein
MSNQQVQLMSRVSNLVKTIMQRGLSGGCHDLEHKEIKMLSLDDWRDFSFLANEWNKSPEDHEENLKRFEATGKNTFIVPDYAVIGVYLDWVEKHLKELANKE